MMAQEWTDTARDVASAVKSVTFVAPREAFLNERLLQFIYEPPNSDAAPLMLIASEAELIVCAGRGTRFELSALPASATEVLRIVEAVVSGRLRERFKGSHVAFKLVLDDGTELAGRSNIDRSTLPDTPEVIEYGPYAR